MSPRACALCTVALCLSACAPPPPEPVTLVQKTLLDDVRDRDGVPLEVRIEEREVVIIDPADAREIERWPVRAHVDVVRFYVPERTDCVTLNAHDRPFSERWFLVFHPFEATRAVPPPGASAEVCPGWEG
jgi:hypothetical protein